MKFVTISDTHNEHRLLELPEGDVLIHAGDITKRGSREEVEDFLDWFNSHNFKYKVMIAGNHDFFFDYGWKAYTDFGRNRHLNKAGDLNSVQDILSQYPGITYLNDSEIIINGIKIWGSPVTPWYHDWAFNRERGSDIVNHWNLIPKDTDILITHGPPLGIGDLVHRGERVGCQDLLTKLGVIKPRVHIFGHIHEGYGIYKSEEYPIKFINASSLGIDNQINDPIVFYLK
jgi:Icc-related predicted phosphoesterase